MDEHAVFKKTKSDFLPPLNKALEEIKKDLGGGNIIKDARGGMEFLWNKLVFSRPRK